MVTASEAEKERGKSCSMDEKWRYNLFEIIKISSGIPANQAVKPIAADISLYLSLQILSLSLSLSAGRNPQS